MFAVNGGIKAGEVLVSVPMDLSWTVECEDDLHIFECEIIYARELTKRRRDPEDPMRLFFETLPTFCNTPVCWEDMDPSIVSKAFWRHVEDRRPDGVILDDELLINLSVVRSYWWGGAIGMLPVAHFFNHDSKKGSALSAYKLGDGIKRQALAAKGDYEVGDEVYISYFPDEGPFIGSATIMHQFGFMVQDVSHDTCEDAVHLRHWLHDQSWRLECIRGLADMGIDIKYLLEEMQVAAEVEDWTWVKGGALAINEILSLE